MGFKFFLHKIFWNLDLLLNTWYRGKSKQLINLRWFLKMSGVVISSQISSLYQFSLDPWFLHVKLRTLDPILDSNMSPHTPKISLDRGQSTRMLSHIISKEVVAETSPLVKPWWILFYRSIWSQGEANFILDHLVPWISEIYTSFKLKCNSCGKDNSYSPCQFSVSKYWYRNINSSSSYVSFPFTQVLTWSSLSWQFGEKW